MPHDQQRQGSGALLPIIPSRCARNADAIGSGLLPRRSPSPAARAASVQQSLAKEVVIWTHGILVLPPIIHDTVACMQART